MISISGLQGLQAKLKKKKKLYSEGIAEGLKMAGLLLQRESQRIVPVDTGLLKASAFTRHTGKGIDCVVRVGYTQVYAVFVHERMDLAHGKAYNEKHAARIASGEYKPRGPSQTAKYLEIPLRTNRQRMIQIVLQHAQAKAESA